ncbi:DUF1345 domain-containing protein [Micromonospora sp. M12]
MTRTGPSRPADVGFPAAKQLAVVAVVGVVVGSAAAVVLPLPLAALAGWDVGALSWLVLVWHKLWPMDAERTAGLAVHEDPNRAIRDALLLVACLASLLAVGLVVASSQSAPRVSTGNCTAAWAFSAWCSPGSWCTPCSPPGTPGSTTPARTAG